RSAPGRSRRARDARMRAGASSSLPSRLGLADEDGRALAVAERLHRDRHRVAAALRELQKPGHGFPLAFVESPGTELLAVVLANLLRSEGGDELPGIRPRPRVVGGVAEVGAMLFRHGKRRAPAR